MNKNIYIIGSLGAGKSTIGREVAKAIKREFYDLDRVIEHNAGVDLSWIHDIEGEDGFRARETKALEELTSRKKLVIATGGGSVMRQENQRILSDGFIIFLDTSVNQQMARLRHDKKRPLLQTDNPREKLEKLFAERKPIYIDLADLRIKTDRKFARKVAAEIIPQLPSNLT